MDIGHLTLLHGKMFNFYICYIIYFEIIFKKKKLLHIRLILPKSFPRKIVHADGLKSVI